MLEEPAQESSEERSVLKDYPEGYANQWGKVTPYHILFKDYGAQLSSMNGPQALELCSNTFDDLAEKYRGDSNYMNPSHDAINKFKKSCVKANTGMDVMFKLKDFLLASEGQSTVATLEEAFANPKIAKKVAEVFNTLISVHDGLKKEVVAEIKTCAWCGDNFEPKWSGEVFCDSECKEDYEEAFKQANEFSNN
ncbi:hypothetical protein D3C71_1144370 [compost metagenome]